jgi:hypothetical protein
MSLINEQWEFLQDVAQLIVFIAKCNFVGTIGDAYRCREYQDMLVAKGVSWTYNSRHLSRLAIDINIFLNETPFVFAGVDAVIPVGRFWESLNEKNIHSLRRGDDGKDLFHFERKV